VSATYSISDKYGAIWGFFSQKMLEDQTLWGRSSRSLRDTSISVTVYHDNTRWQTKLSEVHLKIVPFVSMHALVHQNKTKQKLTTARGLP